MTFKPAFNLIEELKHRGLLHDSFPGTEDLLNKEQVSGYVGFDPTADSLHVGNLVPVFLLRHLQRAGHRPIALVGGATGLVGDPSGKSAERNLLDKDQLQHNLQCIQQQLAKFLDFHAENNAALLVNNYDWFQGLSFLDFIRDVGKHISINYMMAKDSVKNRLETGISFTEFSYQLIQGYDFVHLYQQLGCKLQMGGSDQWGNITTGTELIRRMHGGEAYALTAPLLTKADGSKFGKSEGGNIWLDPQKTSPYKFYQFWLNVSDEEAVKLIKIFTELSLAETEKLIAAHLEAPHLRLLQKTIAEEITRLVHGKDELESAKKASDMLFGKPSREDLLSIGEKTFLQALEGVPGFVVPFSSIQNKVSIVELLATETQVFPSKGEARKMISAGGVSLNKEKVSDVELLIGTESLLFDRFILVQKGKKNYYLLDTKEA
jgi:tyrosyl-tRNA synthetase